jgi:hypothetical protein
LLADLAGFAIIMVFTFDRDLFAFAAFADLSAFAITVLFAKWQAFFF